MIEIKEYTTKELEKLSKEELIEALIELNDEYEDYILNKKEEAEMRDM